MKYVASIPFLMCISLSVDVRTTLSKEVTVSGDDGPSSHCISADEYSTCYDDLNISDGLIQTSNENKYKTFMEQKVNIEEEIDVNYRALSSCLLSVERNFQLNSLGKKNISVSVLIIRPNLCKSTGNILGFFYEAISFALSHGFIVGRLDPLPSETCDMGGSIGRLESYLPRLFIPKNLSTTPLNDEHCNTINQWPWQNSKSYFWNATDVIREVNSKMMKDYSVANVPAQRLGTSLTECVGVHFRCGDSLHHQNYGLYPFHVYREIFRELAMKYRTSKYVIYTDVNKHGRPYGQLCWNLLGELQRTIQRTTGLQHSDVEIHFSTVPHAISMLHMSKVIICSVSTFCFFSSYGYNVVYQPSPVVLFGYPDNKNIINGTNTIFFSTRLLSPRNFPHLDSAQFTDMLLLEQGKM